MFQPPESKGRPRGGREVELESLNAGFEKDSADDPRSRCHSGWTEGVPMHAVDQFIFPLGDLKDPEVDMCRACFRWFWETGYCQCPQYHPHGCTSQQIDRRTCTDASISQGFVFSWQARSVQFATTYLHLQLHGSTPLESLATSDYESKVMSAELRI